MSVFAKVLEELRKALDDEKLHLHRNKYDYKSESGSVIYCNAVDVYYGDELILSSVKKVNSRLSKSRSLYICLDVHTNEYFDNNECKELYGFLDSRIKSGESVLNKAKKINGG